VPLEVKFVEDDGRVLGTSMILCFTLAEEGDNEEACQEKQG